MSPEREGGRVALYLERREDDGVRPSRHLYWLHDHANGPSWRAWFDEAVYTGWLSIAVPAEFQGGDKRQWRLATRYAVVRIRHEPVEALGISAPVLGDVTWEAL
ncbi:MAG: hypothetical protein R3F61_26750 [Myxococcota bacterium]